MNLFRLVPHCISIASCSNIKYKYQRKLKPTRISLLCKSCVADVLLQVQSTLMLYLVYLVFQNLDLYFWFNECNLCTLAGFLNECNMSEWHGSFQCVCVCVCGKFAYETGFILPIDKYFWCSCPYVVCVLYILYTYIVFLLKLKQTLWKQVYHTIIHERCMRGRMFEIGGSFEFFRVFAINFEIFYLTFRFFVLFWLSRLQFSFQLSI